MPKLDEQQLALLVADDDNVQDDTVRAFDQAWANELEIFLDNDSASRKDAIDSIMANRHLIAHGRNTSISVARVRDYLDKAVEVIEFIETQCRG